MEQASTVSPRFLADGWVMAKVHLLCGPAGSGKTGQLLERWRTATRSAPGQVLWLGPNQRTVEGLRQTAARDLADGFALHLFTFQEFVEEIIRVNDPAARPLSNVQRRLLADDLVAQLHARGQLPHFHRVIDTRGFGEGVFAFLAELKRNGIRPDQLAQAVEQRPSHRSGGSEAGRKDRQCTLIYTEYQDRLIRHNLYDVEGRYWYARDLLTENRRRPFEVVRFVFVDGFTDLTGVQVDILEALASRVDELWITLPDEPTDERAELFTRPRATRQRLEDLNPQIEFLPPAQLPAPNGLAHLERQLFRPLRSVVQAADAEGVRLLEAPGMLGETRLVAREIKTLLGSGVAAGDMLVVLREIQPYAELIREVFTEYGIPIDVEGTEPLMRNPAVATLLRTLRLPEDDWPFAGVTAFLRSTYCRPDWPDVSNRADIAQCAEALLRLVGEPRGRAAYLKAVDTWADHPPRGLEDEQAEESRRRRTHELALECRPFLRRYFTAWDGLPARATLAVHVAALRRFAGTLGIERAAAEDPRDAEALRRLWDELEQWVHLNRRFQDGERPRDAGQFFRLLTALAAEAGLARTPRGPGRVRVLSAPLAQTLSAPYLFIMGLGERSFPRLAAPEPFFEEHERQSFKIAGLDFLCLGDLMPDEMLLFYQVVTRARRQLVLSYPAVDDKGQPLLPSSFLNSLLDCFCPDTVPVKGQRMLIEGYTRDRPLSPAEYRVHVAARGAPHAALRPDLAANLTEAARIAQSRFHATDYGCYDGLLRDPAVFAELGQLVGPEQVFSPTALEDYIACPFRFFLGQVLHLEPLEEPREEIESTRRGQAYHRALSRLHHQLQDAGIHQPTEEVDAFLRQRLEEAVAEYAVRGSPASEVLWRLEGQRLQRLATRYRPHWVRFIEPWLPVKVLPRPHFLEKAFGMEPEEGEEPADPLVISIDGIEVRLRGRIDRVDIAELEDGIGFWVIDYKTGHSQHYTARDIQTFERLQLTLYALAVEKVLLAGKNARPLGLAYWLVADNGPKLTLPPNPHQLTAWLKDAQRWPAVREQLERWVATLVSHIRQGTFPLRPRSETCTATCEFAQVCRISQSRSVPKSWQLPLPVVSGEW
jgi:ATP-dependent helicase/DNAse subunit B